MLNLVKLSFFQTPCIFSLMASKAYIFILCMKEPRLVSKHVQLYKYVARIIFLQLAEAPSSLWRNNKGGALDTQQLLESGLRSQPARNRAPGTCKFSNQLPVLHLADGISSIISLNATQKLLDLSHQEAHKFIRTASQLEPKTLSKAKKITCSYFYELLWSMYVSFAFSSARHRFDCFPNPLLLCGSCL